MSHDLDLIRQIVIAVTDIPLKFFSVEPITVP